MLPISANLRSSKIRKLCSFARDWRSVINDSGNEVRISIWVYRSINRERRERVL